jgi:F-type H+-transporting ATPase subunit b
MMKLLFQFAVAFAEEAGHGVAHADPHAIPWGSLFVQAFNFIFLFALLVFLLRKTVSAHFANRAKEYMQLVERAESARQEAEKGRTEIANRLSKLEQSAQGTAQQARSEAEELRARMLEEAKNLSAKLEEEAKRTTAVELEKAKADLRSELLQRALSISTESLKKNLGTSEQKKLQNEFVEKIQVVGG